MSRAKRLDMSSEDWGTKEIAHFLRLDVDYTRDKVVKKHGFPKPSVSRTRSKQWPASQVREWAKGDKQ